MTHSLKNKKIIVSGGTRGIGKAIVTYLAEQGAQIAFSYAKNKDSAEDLLKELEQNKLGSEHKVFSLNLSSSNQVEAQIQEAIQLLGGVDGLVNNAGITKDQILLRMKNEDFQNVIQTNLVGTYLCSKAVLKTMMKQKHGSIVHITSVIGQSGNAGQSNYAASKAGIEAFSKSLALEMASRNIRSNCIAPGFIDTEMTDILTEEQKKKILEQIPMGSIANTTEVASVVSFLLSNEASYITGQSIAVNGGMRM